MFDSEPKELHLAKSITALDDQIKVPDVKKKDLKIICKSAQKIYKEAETSRLHGDQEKAYIYYMRYLGIINKLKEHHKFEQEKDFISTLIGIKSVNEAYDRASKLKDALIPRYDHIIASKLEEFKPEPLDVIMKNDPHTPEKCVDNIIGENEISITSNRLFELCNKNTKNILVLDTRSSADFEMSHIKYKQCINIPEECIEAGLTANRLEKELPQASKKLWSQRANMDLIVLLDWSSVEIITGKKLHLLKTIFLRWDPGVIYKPQPVFLEGGYDGWVLRYPQLTTNPRVVAPLEINLDDMLDDVEYPILHDHVNFGDNSYMPMDTSTDNLSIFKKMNPSIDRSSKAAAIKTYEEQENQYKKIIEKQKNLTETSLDIEKKRISAEENWEQLEQNINGGLINEADDLRKGELESELLKLENDRHDINLLMIENQELKDRIAELLKITETSQPSPIKDNGMANKNVTVTINNIENITTDTLGEDINNDESIKKIEMERAILEKKRHSLETERQKKLSEARTKKKIITFKTDDSENEELSPHKIENQSIASKPQIPLNTIEILDKKPRYDRMMKPLHNLNNALDYQSTQVKREFFGVHGSEGRGLTGLKNLGNTCYMNSIIQCLNNTSPLMRYFCNGIYMDHIHRNGDGTTGKTQGAVAEELAAVVQTLWSDQYRFISPKDLRNVVGRFQSMFRGFEQQDSHEFLTILMDWLHDDLQITKEPKSHIDRLPPAEKAWVEYTKSKESLILRLFYGQIKSTVKCLLCGKESITYDTFSNLSLELPADANKCSLKDCLELYTRDEKILGWNCPSCKEKRSAVKKLDIAKLPPVLVIHFKRFYIDAKDYISHSYKKKQTYIDFPIHNLNMGYYSLRTQDRNSNYNLYGVSNHYGSMEGGHYTAYCKSVHNSRWYKFDDHLVTEISQRDVISSAAYILFYTSYDSALQ